MYKLLIRPILFWFDPEVIHELTFASLKFFFKIPGVSWLSKRLYQINHPALERELFGIRFKNPVGLAAGFDKNAEMIREMEAFGFGFMEIGTVTPKPQHGNPKPRVFRIPRDKALINRMGFNNKGVEYAKKRILNSRYSLVLAGNIGKNKITPNADAIGDYEKGFEALFPFVDFFVVNVSSPNTPNLRELQDKEPLTKLLTRIQELNHQKKHPKPVLLKIAPDVHENQLNDIISICVKVELDGIVATNTTIERTGLSEAEQKVTEMGEGGLSGAPLRKKSTAIIKYLRSNLPHKFPIIAVGGILTKEDAWEKINAGADLVQIYTGFIYEGPGLIKQINRHLIQKWSA
jgi:dihydroorotate dehydrogenase